MTSMTYAEFLTNVCNTVGLSSELLAYRCTVEVATPTNAERATVQEPIWCFVERNAAGRWDHDRYHTADLYLMVRWIIYGWGRNTTGEGPLSTEAEKDVLVPLCLLLDKLCPAFTWVQARQLFHEVTAGTLGEQGQYRETTGDGVLQEYEYTYAYQAVKLPQLYQWLIERGLL